MKIIITWRCFSDNNKSYTFFRNNKELQKEQKQQQQKQQNQQQQKQTNKQTNKQPNKKMKLYYPVWHVLLRLSGAVVVVIAW